MSHTPEVGEDLWDRYVDWCSAKVSEHLLALSPEELWFRAHGREAGSAQHPASFSEIVQALSHQVFLELKLPDFGAWRTQYEQDPRPFEDDLAHVPRSHPADPPKRAQI